MTQHPRIRRRLESLGIAKRLDISADSHTRKVVRRREAHIDALIDDGQVRVIQALLDGVITIAMIDDFAREGSLAGSGLVQLIRGQATLRAAVDALWPKETAAATALRYRLSFDQILQSVPEARRESLLVRELEALDWPAIIAARTSASDAHHVRRAVSRFCTLWYDGKHKDARHAVLKRFPPLPPLRPRTPDLSPAMFVRILQKVREDLRAPLALLAITGMRWGEYWGLRPSHLRHDVHQIHIPGEKTDGSYRTVQVHPLFWPIICAAVPAPLAYRRFWEQWALALGKLHWRGRFRIHDLRHCHAQWAIQGGAHAMQVQRSLGHATAGQTIEYATAAETLSVSTALVPAFATAMALLSTPSGD